MVLPGDALSQWLQQRHASVVRGSLVRLTPSGLPQVSSTLDSHPVRVLLPVLRGGQAAVARAVLDGTQSPELALRVQAVSSQAERVRQMERLVTMLTVAEATRTDPARYPAVLPVLESFVVTLPGDQVPVAAPAAQYELWCDVMPWCPTSLAQARRSTADAPSTTVARVLPLVRTVQAVHEHLNVVHRDITPNNVLVDAAGRLLLADWGIAHTVASDQTSTHTQLVGNRGFSLPPEMLGGNPSVGRFTDAWYLGCVLVWMLTGQPPGPRHGPDLLPDGLPGGPAGADLGLVVQGLCAPDPRQRMSLAEATSRLDRLVQLAGPADWEPAPPAEVVRPGAPTPPSQQLASPPSPVAGRRRLPGWVVVGVGALLVAATVVGWSLKRHADNVVADPSPTVLSCWDDLSVGRCPNIGSKTLLKTFPVKADAPEPECYEAETPDDPEYLGMGNWFDHCIWPDEDTQAQVIPFRDHEAMAGFFLRHEFEQDVAAVPSFVDGPRGPVFSQPVDETMNVAYCYDELPVCMLVSGTPDTITQTTDRFDVMTVDEARQLNEVLTDSAEL